MEQEEAISYDFPVVSGAVAEESELLVGERQQDKRKVRRETVHQAIGQGFGQGPRVGSVVIVWQERDQPGPTPFTAHFTFEQPGREPESVTVTGLVPGDGSWEGESEFEFADGTGKFEGRNRERRPLVSENPKRWG